MSDYRLTEAVLAVAKAIDGLALQVRNLGNGNAATNMGALEAFGKHLGEKIDSATMIIADALDD